MKICVVCHNSGQTVMGDYCRCSWGDKLLKAKYVSRQELHYMALLQGYGYKPVEQVIERVEYIRMELIDLALQTRDKEWFNQLTRGME